MALSEIFQMSLIGRPNDARYQDGGTRAQECGAIASENYASRISLETDHGLRPVSPGASKSLAAPAVTGATDMSCNHGHAF